MPVGGMFRPWKTLPVRKLSPLLPFHHQKNPKPGSFLCSLKPFLDLLKNLLCSPQKTSYMSNKFSHTLLVNMQCSQSQHVNENFKVGVVSGRSILGFFLGGGRSSQQQRRRKIYLIEKYSPTLWTLSFYSFRGSSV